MQCGHHIRKVFCLQSAVMGQCFLRLSQPRSFEICNQATLHRIMPTHLVCRRNATDNSRRHANTLNAKHQDGICLAPRVTDTLRQVQHRHYSAPGVPDASDKGVDVYYGTLTPQIRMVKTFSLCTSFTGVLAFPFFLQQLNTTNDLFYTVGLSGFIGIFTFMTPILLHLLTRKYAVSVHYKNSTDTYTATTLSIFLRKKLLSFKVEDVVVPEVPGLFTTFEAKGKPLFVDPQNFEDLSHFGRIMGYDKPMDFKMVEDDGKKQK